MPACHRVLDLHVSANGRVAIFLNWRHLLLLRRPADRYTSGLKT